MTDIVAISDTHCQLHRIKIPYADILIHAGDLTFRGTRQEIEEELDKLVEFKEKVPEIVLVCGNHDWLGETNPELMKQLCSDRGLHYLNDSEITVQGIRIWGSPISPEFFHWAFNRERGYKIREHWNLIPKDGIDILVTHSPPYGILDMVPKSGMQGCADLREIVFEQVKPKYHIFGHIHTQGGEQREEKGITFINAALLNDSYDLVTKPIEFKYGK